MSSFIEQLIVDNIKVFTPKIVIAELRSLVERCDTYSKEVEHYVRRLDDIVLELDSMYRQNYELCLARKDCSLLFDTTCYILIQTLRLLSKLKNEYSLYHLKMNRFLDELKTLTSKYIAHINEVSVYD